MLSLIVVSVAGLSSAIVTVSIVADCGPSAGFFASAPEVVGEPGGAAVISASPLPVSSDDPQPARTAVRPASTSETILVFIWGGDSRSTRRTGSVLLVGASQSTELGLGVEGRFSDKGRWTHVRSGLGLTPLDRR